MIVVSGEYVDIRGLLWAAASMTAILGNLDDNTSETQ